MAHCNTHNNGSKTQLSTRISPIVTQFSFLNDKYFLHHDPHHLCQGNYRGDGDDGQEGGDDEDAGGVGTVSAEADGQHRVGGPRWRGGRHDDDQQNHGIDGDEREGGDHGDGDHDEPDGRGSVEPQLLEPVDASALGYAGTGHQHGQGGVQVTHQVHRFEDQGGEPDLGQEEDETGEHPYDGR